MKMYKTQRLNQKKNGFTLVELLVYIAILTLALTSVIILLTNATKILSRVKEAKQVRASALTLHERLDREIKNARGITMSENTFGTSPGKLVLQSTDEAGDPRTVTFEQNGTGFEILYNGVSRGTLISDDVTLTNIVFHYLDNTLSDSVVADFTLTHNENASKEESFSLTSVLRGSY